MASMKNARFDSERDADKSPADGDARTAGLIHLKPGRISSDKSLKKEVSMHQLIKAMTFAGMVATGLPLLTEAANAQTIYTWYQFTPQSCEATIIPHSDGSISTTMYIGVILNGTFTTIYMPNSQLISGLYKSCADGSGFWAWYAGPAAGWTDYYTYPGLR